VVDCCECGNEQYGSTKYGDLLSSRVQLLKRESTVRRVGLTQITQGVEATAPRGVISSIFMHPAM
jgi:hypothetical protein